MPKLRGLFCAALVACISLRCTSASLAADAASAIADGRSKIVVELGGHEIDVFTYRPQGYADGPLLIVCHGTNRNADEYRDFACGLADRIGALVAAPRFDQKRFPVAAYQYGGIRRQSKTQPAECWTVSYVSDLVDAIRRREKAPDRPYYLIGHSAGGQFLVRLAGTTQTGAMQVVAANPGSHLFPTREIPYPHGFGGLSDELSNDAALQRYLAQPLTIYLGTHDLGSENLPNKPDAVRQGATRYERGKNCYRVAEKLAKERGWKFNWRLVEAPGIEHSAEEMFNHDNAIQALGIAVINQPSGR